MWHYLPRYIHLSVCNFAFTIESWRSLRSRPSRGMRELVSCAADQDETFPRGINAVAADLGPGAATGGTMGRWRSGLRSAWDCATRARCQHHRQPTAARCCPLAQLSFRSHHHHQTWKRCLTMFGMESTIICLLLHVESSFTHKESINN